MTMSIKSSPMFSDPVEDTLTLYTVEEVAELLMVGKNRIYELLGQKKLKGMRIGNSAWRISRAAIYQFIKNESQL